MLMLFKNTDLLMDYIHEYAKNSELNAEQNDGFLRLLDAGYEIGDIVRYIGKMNTEQIEFAIDLKKNPPVGEPERSDQENLSKSSKFDSSIVYGKEIPNPAYGLFHDDDYMP